ncbi:MAG: flippase-like domain-containing protein [Candidatus Micrarchaeales archaeon]|nr:flippase-like domain-containing protein [Candidatus Micrarchaeales archaeon]
MALLKKKDPKESFWYTAVHRKTVSSEEYKKSVNKVITIVLLVFAVSFVVFLAIAVLGGITNVISIMTHSNLELYGLAFLFVFLGYVVSFGKWTFFMKKLNIKVPILKNFAVYMSMYSMELTPGRIGRVICAYTLHRITRVPIMKVAPIVTMDLVTDFFGAAVVAVIGAVYFNKFVAIVLLGAVISVLPTIFVLNDWFFRLLKKLLKKTKYIPAMTLFGNQYFRTQHKLNKPSVYLTAMVFTIPSALLYAMALYFTLLAIGAAPSVSGSVLIYYSSNIIGTMTGLPGNVGVTDGAMVAMLQGILHLSIPASSAVTIMTRIATLWFGLVLGGIFLLYTLRFWKLRVGERWIQIT